MHHWCIFLAICHTCRPCGLTLPRERLRLILPRTVSATLAVSGCIGSPLLPRNQILLVQREWGESARLPSLKAVSAQVMTSLPSLVVSCRLVYFILFQSPTATELRSMAGSDRLVAIAKLCTLGGSGTMGRFPSAEPVLEGGSALNV